MKLMREYIFSEFILEGSGGVAGNVPVYHLEKMYHVSNLFRPIQLVLVFTASNWSRRFTGKGLNLKGQTAGASVIPCM